jgi:hypothetical protein
MKANKIYIDKAVNKARNRFMCYGPGDRPKNLSKILKQFRHYNFWNAVINGK